MLHYALIFLVIAIIAAVLFSRSITGPIRELVAAMSRLAGGDTTIELKGETRKAEDANRRIERLLSDLSDREDRLERRENEIARLKGDTVAQAIQLAIEYDPAPPFAGGHPDRAPTAITDGLKARVYDAAAARMEAALDR